MVCITMASSQLLWQLVKNNHAFLHKGLHGAQFSAEPGNLYNINSYKYSGEVRCDVPLETLGSGAVRGLTCGLCCTHDALQLLLLQQSTPQCCHHA